MKSYLCEFPNAYGYRRWIEAEGPSQAAVKFAEQGIHCGTTRVAVFDDSKTFPFDVTVRVGQPSSVRWIRDWGE